MAEGPGNVETPLPLMNPSEQDPYLETHMLILEI